MYEKSTVALKDGELRAERLEKAIFYYQNALNVSKETGFTEIKSASWEGLSKVYEVQGKYKEAFEVFQKHVILKDSIGSSNVKKQIAKKEIEFEFSKKETALKYEQQLTIGELDKQRLLTFQQGQTLTLREQSLSLSNKEKDLVHLAYLKEQAEKQEKVEQLALSEEREKGKKKTCL